MYDLRIEYLEYRLIINGRGKSAANGICLLRCYEGDIMFTPIAVCY